jgi:hypothetical protein
MNRLMGSHCVFSDLTFGVAPQKLGAPFTPTSLPSAGFHHSTSFPPRFPTVARYSQRCAMVNKAKEGVPIG